MKESASERASERERAREREVCAWWRDSLLFRREEAPDNPTVARAAVFDVYRV
jgi:hypothetical protein